ncbi:HAD family hydrolase [Spirulina sp. 06S082]|uniref:HAD family hydrolase n=1 Tax=Spirulina sp. 06S082 TaxID=3110248 RepID=UPI002B21BE83|nr:HAD family hydrolase [Spirulina sp. 06S082]MEA5468982.1 HAD family hydrolase [Spirulina sp. 06S082]
MVKIRCGNKVFSNIEGILFDKDGTLEDSQNFLRELAQKRSRLIDARIPGIGEPLLMAFGLNEGSLDPTGLMAVGSRRDNQIAAAAYIAETGRSWHEALEIARFAFEEADKYIQRTPQNSPLFPGSLAVLQSLSATELKLGILSADSTPGVENFIDRAGIGNYINLARGVEPNGPGKPEPRLFLEACDALSTTPETTLMVGDSALDFEMAQNAGSAGVVGICWGNANAPVLRKADVAIAHLNELVIIDGE